MAGTTTKKKSTSTTTKKTTTSSTRKKSTTSSAKKTVNSSVSAKLSEASGVDKKIISTGLKQVGKLSVGGRIAVALAFIIGVGAGFVGVRVIQRNDQFRLVNGETYTVNVNETVDLNDIAKYVVCVSYGFDATSSVSVSIKDSQSKVLDTSVEKEYVITYSSSNIKYRNIQLTQVINVVNLEDSYGE